MICGLLLDKPQIMYTNIQTRPKQCTPHVDIYAAGFPCQPFSAMGKGLGCQDDRGRIIDHIIAYIM